MQERLLSQGKNAVQVGGVCFLKWKSCFIWRMQHLSTLNIICHASAQLFSLVVMFGVFIGWKIRQSPANK